MYGTQRAKVTVDHVYDGVYYTPRTVSRAFGLSGQVEITGSRARSEIMLGQSFDEQLTFDPPTTSGVGGWSLNVQHVYDPCSRTLARGDGGEEEREFSALSATTVAGGGATAPTPTGTPAKQAYFNPTIGARSVAVGPNGSVVVGGWTQFYRLDIDGLVRRLPDLPVLGGYGDAAQIAIDRQNRLLVGVPADPTGICGEGGSAGGVSLWMLDAANVWSEVTTVTTPERIDSCGNPQLAVGADDTIYVTQGPFLYQFRPGDSAPALIAQVGVDAYVRYHGIAVGADGSVYAGSYGFIDKIDPSGSRTRVAGTGTPGHGGDNGPATAAQLSVASSLQVEPAARCISWIGRRCHR